MPDSEAGFARMNLIERFIQSEQELDGDDARLKVRTFVFIFVMGCSAEYLGEAARWRGQWTLANYVDLSVGPFAIALILIPRLRRFGFAMMAFMVLARIYGSFPMAGNHVHLHLIIFSLLALLRIDDATERAWFIGALKWVTLVVFFYSGLQKLLHGHYLQGEFMAYTIARSQVFNDFFRWIIPQTEIKRLHSYAWEIGTGPYQLFSMRGLLMSWGTIVGEMATPFLMIFRRTRILGVLIALGLLLAIELGAHEFYFGLLYLNLLLLFLKARFPIALPIVFAVIYLVLLLSRLGIILPEMHFG